MSISIKKNNTVETINELLAAIHKSINAQDNQPISLPLNLGHGKIGSRALLIQAFITIYRLKPDTQLYCRYLDVSDPENINSFLSDPHILVAVLMSSTLLDKNGDSVKGQINKFLIDRFTSLNGHTRGRQLQLFTVDHSIHRFKYPQFFYDSPEKESPTVKEGNSFASILKNHAKERLKLNKLHLSDYDNIGRLLSELILNTHQHALADTNGREHFRSVRGITFDYHLIPKNSAAAYMEEQESCFSEYVAALSNSRGASTLHLLEITIFDSGPGLYSRQESESISPAIKLKDELNIVKSCFRKNVTSKRDAVGYGRGLTRVMSVLNEHGGMLTLRTGRLSLYRNFIIHPQEHNDDIEIYDVETNSTIDPSGHYEVQGAAYTIMVPLK